MKKALLIGCGSKWGASFTKHLADIGYQVDLLTSSDFEYPNVNTIKVNWFESNLEQLKTLIDNNNFYTSDKFITYSLFRLSYFNLMFM